MSFAKSLFRAPSAPSMAAPAAPAATPTDDDEQAAAAAKKAVGEDMPHRGRRTTMIAGMKIASDQVKARYASRLGE